MNRKLPSGIHVVAQSEHASALKASLGDGVTVVPSSTTEDVTSDVLSRASILVLEVDPGQPDSMARLSDVRSRRPSLPVIVALAERLHAIDTTFSQRTAETDRMLGEHARATTETFGNQTAQLNQVLANNAQIMQQTANQVGAQSKEAVSVLTSQTQTLREVSRGLLEQIHGLTQRFENQGQAILTAAKALDSSNTKIDSILEGRHQAIIALLHTVNTKSKDLDNMMRSYAGMVENAMSQAEASNCHRSRPCTADRGNA